MRCVDTSCVADRGMWLLALRPVGTADACWMLQTDFGLSAVWQVTNGMFTGTAGTRRCEAVLAKTAAWETAGCCVSLRLARSAGRDWWRCCQAQLGFIKPLCALLHVASP